MSCHSWRRTGAVGKPSMTTITSCGKSSSVKDLSCSSSLQRDKGGQLAASSDRQFRFSREPREEVVTLQKCSNREARKGIPIAGEKLECVSPKTFVWKLQADDLHVIRGKQMARALISTRCAFGEFCCCYWRQSWVDVPLSTGLMFFSSPWPAPLPTHPVPQPRVHWHLLLCLHCRVFPLYSTHLTHVCYYLPFLCRWVIKWLQLCSMNSQPSSETVA